MPRTYLEIMMDDSKVFFKDCLKFIFVVAAFSLICYFMSKILQCGQAWAVFISFSCIMFIGVIYFCIAEWISNAKDKSLDEIEKEMEESRPDYDGTLRGFGTRRRPRV